MAKRSRRGCATCRKRKKKCDEQRPACGQCVSRRVRCGGYHLKLKWNKTSALEDSSTTIGDETASLSAAQPPPTPGAESELSISAPGSHRSRHRSDVLIEGIPYSQDHPLPLARGPSSTGTLISQTWEAQSPLFGDEAEQDLALEMFLEKGIHSLHAAKADECNTEAIRDLLPSSQVLRLVCVALQEVITHGSSVSALERTGRALEMFRRQVSTDFSPTYEALLMTGVLLCTLHLIQGLPWTSTFTHFLDFFHIVDSFSHLRPNPSYNLSMRHQIESMSILDFPNFILGRVSPSRGLWKRFRELQKSWSGFSSSGGCIGVNSITGLPHTLLDIMAPEQSETLAESQRREQQLWDWPGQVGAEFWECQLWDSYKYAGILAARHQQSLRSHTLYNETTRPNQSALTNKDTTVPTTDILLYRLLSCLDAMFNEKKRAIGPTSLQLQHLALFPIVHASLQVETLRTIDKYHWREGLLGMRDQILGLEAGGKKHTLILFEILDKAWADGKDGFDADNAAKGYGVEITLI